MKTINVDLYKEYMFFEVLNLIEQHHYFCKIELLVNTNYALNLIKKQEIEQKIQKLLDSNLVELTVI